MTALLIGGPAHGVTQEIPSQLPRGHRLIVRQNILGRTHELVYEAAETTKAGQNFYYSGTAD
jgi:hypothetical protein